VTGEKTLLRQYFIKVVLLSQSSIYIYIYIHIYKYKYYMSDSICGNSRNEGSQRIHVHGCYVITFALVKSV
jgi:hypothetical protein